MGKQQAAPALLARSKVEEEAVEAGPQEPAALLGLQY